MLLRRTPREGVGGLRTALGHAGLPPPVELQVEVAESLGDQVVELHGVGHRFSDSWLFRGLDLALDRRETLYYVADHDDAGRPLRAQGGKKNHSYYREASLMRGFSDCPHTGMSIQARVADEQIGRVMQAFQFPDDWQETIEKISTGEEERQKVLVERKRLEDRMRRVVEMYEDGALNRVEYEKRRQAIAREMETLVLPDNDNQQMHGVQVETFRDIWPYAKAEEKREICRLLIQSADIDLKEKRIVRLTPNKEFLWFFKHNHFLIEQPNRSDFLVDEQVMGKEGE